MPSAAHCATQLHGHHLDFLHGARPPTSPKPLGQAGYSRELVWAISTLTGYQRYRIPACSPGLLPAWLQARRGGTAVPRSQRSTKARILPATSHCGSAAVTAPTKGALETRDVCLVLSDLGWAAAVTQAAPRPSPPAGFPASPSLGSRQ